MLGAALLGAGLAFTPSAHAQREVRAGTRTSVNQSANVNRNVNQNTNVRSTRT